MYEALTTKEKHAVPVRKLIPNRPRKSMLTLSSPHGAQAVSFLTSDNTLSQYYDRDSDTTYMEQCFKVISCIGHGCFGVVYKVNSLEDGKLYAIKKSRERFRNANDKRRKLAEVERLEKIPKHPNCIQMHRAWEENGFLYLQLELCELSLAEYTLTNHKIPEDTIWNILTDITLALKHLHDRNIMHLDIKLDNILMSKGGTFKLGDFGISLDCSQKFRDFTDGDAKYIAPEVLTENFTKSADIFSLGISMFELSFDVNLPQCGVLWQSLRNGQIPHLRDDAISQDLFELMKWMMQPDPDKRPSADMILKHIHIKIILLKRKFALLLESLTASGKLIVSILSCFGKAGYDMVMTALFKQWPLNQDSPALGLDALGIIDEDHKEDSHEVVTSTPKWNPLLENSKITPERLHDSWEISECFDTSADTGRFSKIGGSPSDDFLRSIPSDSGYKRCRNRRVHPYSSITRRNCHHPLRKNFSTVRNLLNDFSK